MKQSPVNGGTETEAGPVDAPSAAPIRASRLVPQQLLASATATTTDATDRLQNWVGRLNTSRVPGVTRNSGWQAVHAELARSRTQPKQ